MLSNSASLFTISRFLLNRFRKLEKTSHMLGYHIMFAYLRNNPRIPQMITKRRKSKSETLEL